MPDPCRPIAASPVGRAGSCGLLVLSLLLLAGGLRAQTVPALTGRVVDTADVLSPTTEAALTARLAALEDSSTAQVVVLTIPSLGGEVLEEYTTDVFRAWGLGQADRDNGVLLLVAHADRQLRIEVGYGLEGDLTDARAGAIIRDEIVPRFREGDFDAGVIAGVDAIIGTIEGSYEPAAFLGAPEGVPWGDVLFALSLFGIVPMGLGYAARHVRPLGRYLTLFATSAFVLIAAGNLMRAGIPAPWNPWLGLALLLGYPLAFVGLDLWYTLTPTGRARRSHARRRAEAIRAAQRKGRSEVVVDGVTYSVPTYSSSGGSSGGGSSFSSSSFSGGGGSSGGGGASGSW